jgi:hypothetical protein
VKEGILQTQHRKGALGVVDMGQTGRAQPIRSRRTIALLLSILVLGGIGARNARGDFGGGASDIPVLAGGSGTLRVDLVPEDAEGFLCSGCEGLVRMRIDGKEVPHEIQAEGEGGAALTASFSGLEDGRHKAAADSLVPGDRVTCVRETLFIVDTRPPALELLEPETLRIQPTQSAFQVRCRDEGSGISPEPGASGLSVTINGREVPVRLAEEQADLILVIAAPHDEPWEPGGSVTLHVRLRDRAGNAAELQRTFTVDAPEEEHRFESVDCAPGDSQYQGLFLLRRIPFPLRTSAHWIRFDAASRSVSLPFELSSVRGEPLDPVVYDALEVVSNHPSVRVEGPVRSPASTEVTFRVSQVAQAEGGDGLGSITIRYPESVVLDHDLQCGGGEPGAVLRGMRPEGPLRSYRVPVFLYAETGYSDEVRVDGELMRYRFLLAGPGRLDTASSWLDVEGKRVWLDRTGPGAYEASLSLSEGLHVYTARLALSLWGWGSAPEGRVSDDGRSLQRSGEVFVTLDPPRIEGFHYDRENECLQAGVSDRGTALEDLVLELSVSGAGGLDPGWDPEAGALLSPFALPWGIQAARLEVTDLAGQTTTASCRILGFTPEARRLEARPSEHPVSIKTSEDSGARRPAGSPSNWRISRQYRGVYRDGKEAVTECIRTTLPITREHPLTRCLKRAWALYGTVSPQGGTDDSSLKATSTAPLSRSPALERAEAACRNKYPPGTGHRWSREPEVRCRSTWVDTLPPRIREVAFLPAERRVTALIDDHGMPLSQVRVDYLVEPAPLSRPHYRTARPFTFDTETGLFLGETTQGRENELFKVEIKATDAARNWSRKWLDVTAPAHPPELSLEVLERGAAACPLGTCSDGSGVDHRRTRAWLDGVRVAPVGIRYGGGGAPDRVDLGPVTEEGPHLARLEVWDFAGLSSEASTAFQVTLPPEIERFRSLPVSLQKAGGPAFSALIRDRGGDLDLGGIQLTVNDEPVPAERFYYDPRSGYFAADGPLDLGPGVHLARLTATDAHGNSDTAVLRFVPGERVQTPGRGGGDLSIAEATLWELEDHNGDGKANPGETVRLFVSLTNHGPARLSRVSGLLESGEAGIVVEEDRVVYGDLGPGETVAPLNGFDLRIDEGFLDTRPSEPCEARFTLEAGPGDGRAWLLDLVLPVYRPTLPVSVDASRQTPAAADPSGPADPDQPDPAAPVMSEVTVMLEGLPVNTEASEIEISGTAASSASTIEEVVVRVNGIGHPAAWNEAAGTFAATVPLDVGDNLVEAEAVDRTGASGMDAGFVHRSEPFVPPEIEITEPVHGEAFLCGEVFLGGGFDAGSSSVAVLQASMSAEGETVSLPTGFSSDEGSFWAGDEGPESLVGHFRPGWGDNHVTTITLTVILTTTDGDTAQDTVTFTYVCWS